MTSKNHDPWREFRKENGEFRRWLHTWSYNTIPLTGERNVTPWFVYAPLPWVIQEPLSGEALRAMYNLGITARWPGEWPRFGPDRVFYALPVYGMVLPTSGEQAVIKHLNGVRRQCASSEEFMDRLNRRYVLFPKRQE